MSERYASACAGKHHYRSQRRADDAAKESQIKFGIPLNSYECPFHPKMFVVGSTYPQYAKAARRERGEECRFLVLVKNRSCYIAVPKVLIRNENGALML